MGLHVVVPLSRRQDWANEPVRVHGRPRWIEKNRPGGEDAGAGGGAERGGGGNPSGLGTCVDYCCCGPRPWPGIMPEPGPMP